jgi:nucleotide-binding universal stress UspA family protein
MPPSPSPQEPGRTDKQIVIAVDTEERTLDALALGRLMAEATGAPAVLVTVFPYFPLQDTGSAEMTRVRDEARSALVELARSEALDAAEAQVVPGNSAARELQRVTEQPTTGLIVVGSTTRGPVGRLLIGGVGERLLSGAACPVAVAPNGYTERRPSRLARIGVGIDGSDEARRALHAAVSLATAAGATVRVVTAFQRLAFGGVPAGALPSASANETMRAELHVVHDRAVAAARGKVEVEGRFREGSSQEVLAEESGDVDLLVLGSRGYGPRAAVLLGSTSTALARTAACPILVVPREASFQLLPDVLAG